jgi:hypothetical protein
MSPRAQGTIEYLVVIGVVVVISLVVVGLMTSTIGGSSSSVAATSGKISQVSGSISITEAVVDNDSNGLFTLTNNSGDSLTITSISVDGVPTNYSNVTLTTGDKKTFNVPTVGSACSCAGFEGKTKICSLILSAQTQYGLQKTFPSIMTVNCVTDATPTNPPSVIQPINTTPIVCSFSGAGTLTDPIKICDCNDLQKMNLDLDANYALWQDINCSSTRSWNSNAGFIPIGNDSTQFTGSLDGNNHVISSLFINRPTTTRIGLFGYANNGASVSKVGITDANVVGFQMTGILAGRFVGSISKSFTTGYSTSVCNACNEGGYAGGLVGSILAGATIRDSYSTAQVSVRNEGGGLVGENKGDINRSYATGTVIRLDGSSPYRFGGLVGNGYQGTIEYSYATGATPTGSNAGGFAGYCGTISNVYWNDTPSNANICCGQDAPSGCTSISNNASYFYSATNSPLKNWDFVNTWSICPGTSYPFLKWENRTC